MRERRLASRLGFHGTGSATTSTRPSAVTVRQAKAEESTELLHTRVVLPATPPLGGTDSEPDLVAGGCAINGLKHQFEREALLHLADHDEFGRAIGKGDEIASAHLALDLQAEPLQMALDRWIEVGFQGRCPLMRT
jgi:hypothetical protein